MKKLGANDNDEDILEQEDENNANKEADLVNEYEEFLAKK